jgi:hypothetical protein
MCGDETTALTVFMGNLKMMVKSTVDKINTADKQYIDSGHESMFAPIIYAPISL